jgi:hypothetical protein
MWHAARLCTLPRVDSAAAIAYVRARKSGVTSALRRFPVGKIRREIVND